MNKEIKRIYGDAIADSYFLKRKNAYWTGYFFGKLDMSVSDKDLNKFYEKVKIASQKLYEMKVSA